MTSINCFEMKSLRLMGSSVHSLYGNPGRFVPRYTMIFMSTPTDEFYRISKLPPYVFAVVNEMKARLRADQHDVVDLGMGNPDGATPKVIVNKAIEALRNSKNHRYSVSKG